MDYLDFIVNLDEYKYVISKILNKNDFYNMRLINKYWYNNFINNLIYPIFKRIKNKLNNLLYENVPSMLEILKNTGAVISGSFILSCILDEEYDGDIDIYIYKQKINNRMTHNYTELCNFLYNNCKLEHHDSKSSMYKINNKDTKNVDIIAINKKM